MLLML
ncbi:hypothetical protein F383_08899 [Gossypium arboreum]